MTLRDYARFGQFILEGGRANERAVLPDGWIRTATTNQVPPGAMDAATKATYGDYGYFWWSYPNGVYEAHGLFEQVISVYPQDRIVIALNSAVLRPTEAETRDAIRTLI